MHTNGQVEFEQKSSNNRSKMMYITNHLKFRSKFEYSFENLSKAIQVFNKTNAAKAIALPKICFAKS